MTVLWTFPELTDDENEIVVHARRLGFAAFYPCYPNAEAQARNTYLGAAEFMRLLEGVCDCGRKKSDH